MTEATVWQNNKLNPKKLTIHPKKQRKSESKTTNWIGQRRLLPTVVCNNSLLFKNLAKNHLMFWQAADVFPTVCQLAQDENDNALRLAFYNKTEPQRAAHAITSWS